MLKIIKIFKKIKLNKIESKNNQAEQFTTHRKKQANLNKTKRNKLAKLLQIITYIQSNKSKIEKIR